MAKKQELVARVRYSKKDDAFIIEIQDGNDWNLCSAYPCRKAEGFSGDTDHVHFSLVNQILEMVQMGYYIYKSDAED